MSLRELNEQRTLAVFGLLGAVRIIAGDVAGLGAEYQQRSLRRVLAECEAKIAAAEARFDPANDVRGL